MCLIPDVVVSVVGLLGDQAENETDLEKATRVMRSNYEGPALLLGIFANLFEQRGSGTLVGVSSVAGDRGRAANCVHVVTIKPGFVRTQMTEGMKLPAPLTAAPEEVAEATLKAVRKKQSTVYTRPVWLLIMFIIRHLPEPIFKKMKA